MNMRENEVPAALQAACAAADDAELVASLRQGQAGAYERLMRRYNRLLFRTARGIVPDDADAQDAVQEAYLRAFTALDGFRGESTLATWLVRIVIHQALQQQRRRGRLVPWDEHLPMEDSDMPLNTADPLDGACAENPEQAAARQQLRRQLEAAIDVLPPMYRCVFILRAVQDLSVEQTADALRVSGDVVKTRYLRARGMLRATLGAAPAAALPAVHDFQGRRCDELVRQVLAALRAAGVVRDPEAFPTSLRLPEATTKGAPMPAHPGQPSFLRATRRESLFGAAAVLSAGAVALLAGRDSLARAAKLTQVQVDGDMRILNTARAAELEAVAAYQLGAESGLLGAGARAIALQFQGHHKEHADVLAGTIRKLGGQVADAPARYDFPTDKLKAEADVLRFAATLERGAVSAYLNAVPLFQDRALAHAAASILGDEAMHWAVFRQVLGEQPVVPGAFLS